MVLGGFNGFATYYRFAAAEVAPEEFRSRAISLVMAGGIVAARVERRSGLALEASIAG